MGFGLSEACGSIAFDLVACASMTVVAGAMLVTGRTMEEGAFVLDIEDVRVAVFDSALAKDFEAAPAMFIVALTLFLMILLVVCDCIEGVLCSDTVEGLHNN